MIYIYIGHETTPVLCALHQRLRSSLKVYVHTSTFFTLLYFVRNNVRRDSEYKYTESLAECGITRHYEAGKRYSAAEKKG